MRNPKYEYHIDTSKTKYPEIYVAIFCLETQQFQCYKSFKDIESAEKFCNNWSK